jgi:hypothetical protein
LLLDQLSDELTDECRSEPDALLWANWRKPCGTNFVAQSFFENHPEYAPLKPYTEDVISYPWTLFDARWEKKEHHINNVSR